jgi:hypothetical protein
VGAPSILLRGRDAPDPQTLGDAQRLVAEFATFHESLQQYLAAAAASARWSRYAAELGAQAPGRVQLEPDGHTVQVFLETAAGVDGGRAWYCMWQHGRFTELGFDD